MRNEAPGNVERRAANREALKQQLEQVAAQSTRADPAEAKARTNTQSAMLMTWGK